MTVPTQRWKVLVAKLGASTVLHEGEVDATNWMSALRAARQAMSQRPSLPPGASCTVDAQGIATVLDPSSRRKFVLSPLSHALDAPQSPRTPSSVVAAAPTPPATKSNKRFETVAFVPQPQGAPAAQSPAPQP